MTNNASTGFHWTFERALERARCSVVSNGSWFTPEAIATRMVEHDAGVWHACHLVSLDAIASGEAGYADCRFCGGPTAPNQGGEHALCKARAARGHETPRLDSTPVCHCSPCSKARAMR